MNYCISTTGLYNYLCICARVSWDSGKRTSQLWHACFILRLFIRSTQHFISITKYRFQVVYGCMGAFGFHSIVWLFCVRFFSSFSLFRSSQNVLSELVTWCGGFSIHILMKYELLINFFLAVVLHTSAKTQEKINSQYEGKIHQFHLFYWFELPLIYASNMVRNENVCTNEFD